jgi:hypothetical protein
MRRRTLLGRIGLAGTAVAGLGAGTAAATRVVGADFDTTETICTAGQASVTFGTDGVGIDGCFETNSTCREPTLADLKYDSGSDTLSVLVASALNDDPVCSPTFTTYDYTATVRFEGGVPGRVVVVHDNYDGRTVVADESAIQPY